jgi:hypothetical protein
VRCQDLEGVEIDYVTNMMGQGFTFQNPKASGGCGCSFTVLSPAEADNGLSALSRSASLPSRLESLRLG